MASKKPLSQIIAERKAKKSAIKTSVSNAGILGMIKRDKERKFKRGTSGTATM